MPSCQVTRVGPVIDSAPVGSSRRTYANSALLVATTLEPEALLAELKRIEREFGRRAAEPRWRARLLDLDIILWSGGVFASPGLTIPHPRFRQRAFVLQPAAAIAPAWRDPVTGLTVRQLRTRLTGTRPLPRSRCVLHAGQCPPPGGP